MKKDQRREEMAAADGRLRPCLGGAELHKDAQAEVQRELKTDLSIEDMTAAHGRLQSLLGRGG